MLGKAFRKVAPHVSSEARKVVISHPIENGFDPQDSLHAIREYRLRKIASKRIPSRVS